MSGDTPELNLTPAQELDLYVRVFVGEKREAGTTHRGVVLEGDQQALRVAAAWDAVKIGWTRPEGNPPDGADDLWEWLWSGVHVDMYELADRAGVNDDVARAKMDVLRSARLIMPNGKLSMLAQGLMRSKVARAAK